MKKALILGITGQDGSYLADLLVSRGYEVHGMVRPTSTGNLRNIQHLLEKLTLHRGDMLDPLSVHSAILRSSPDEIYNEADQDSVGWSYSVPGYNYDVTFRAVGNLLESVRTIDPEIRVFQPCSATMFRAQDQLYPRQGEDALIAPMSPYSCAKAGAYYLARYYREVHGMYVSTAILYPHTSPRQRDDYLIPSLCRRAVRVRAGVEKTIPVGDPETVVDVGFAGEYVKAIYRVMQLDGPDDFVVGTGVGRTVREVVAEVCGQVGVDSVDFEFVRDPGYTRPRVRQTLVADARKVREATGWVPEWDLGRTVAMMVSHYGVREFRDETARKYVNGNGGQCR